MGSRNYFHALFFFHLTVEKLVKGLWVRDNIGNTPPRSHDTIYLLSQTEVELSTEQLDLLRLVNTWNIETRYPDYKFLLYKQATEGYTRQKEKEVATLRQCLLAEL